jgi:iron complex transport system substrate-binding protein
VNIVSLLPSATEIVYALGLGEDLAAVTFECDHPPEAQSKPVVVRTALPTEQALPPGEVDRMVREKMEQRQPIYELDRDLIRRIQPDLILAQDLCRVCAIPSGHVQEALDDLGTTAKVVSLDPGDVGGILEGIEEVGRATGTERRASEITAALGERIEAVRRTAARLPTIRTLCMEWLDPPYAGGHWIPEMVEAAGGQNLLSQKGAPSRVVGWREIADAQPEVVVFMPCGYYLAEAEEEAARLYGVPEFRETSAHAAQNVLAVDASSFFSRPGPRIVDGLEILAWAIHPRSFPEPPEGTIERVAPRQTGR